MRLQDISGRRFGRMYVIARGAAGRSPKQTYWECICDCGTRKVVNGRYLRGGQSNSCGCLQRERTSKARRTHGLSKSAEYRTWNHIIARCENPKVSEYRLYGGRGIRMCERWRSSFECFYADMGPRPSPKHSIDRVNNDGDYEPGNCRWATIQVQANNRRTNLVVHYQGQAMSLVSAVRTAGNIVGQMCARHRIVTRGWEVARAVETPPAKRRNATTMEASHE